MQERELKKQVQAEYDATAPVQDIRAQLTGTAESVDLVLPTPPLYDFPPLHYRASCEEVLWRMMLPLPPRILAIRHFCVSPNSRISLE